MFRVEESFYPPTFYPIGMPKTTLRFQISITQLNELQFVVANSNIIREVAENWAESVNYLAV